MGFIDFVLPVLLSLFTDKRLVFYLKANGWWFLDNNEPLATAVAGIRYTLPEAGGIILLPTNAEIVDEYLSQVWPYW